MRSLNNTEEFKFMSFIASEFNIPEHILLHQHDVLFSVYEKMYIVPSLRYLRFLHFKDRCRKHVRRWERRGLWTS